MSDKKGKDFWGPKVWTGMHSLSVFVHQKLGMEYSRCWWALTKLIACVMCQTNLIKKLKLHPPEKYTENPQTTFFHTYVIHDLVNQHINETHPDTPKVSPPFDEVYSHYFSLKKPKILFNIYQMLHTLSTTYIPEHAGIFSQFVSDISAIIPGVFPSGLDVKLYLRNNHDLFVWTYLSRTKVLKRKSQSGDFHKLKTLYFNALDEECKDCKT